ncbi:hypothetical protein ACIQBJ_32050 [Kitasatospora sp. NPDC088391]|uniref:hypothetical protein n=1 Tax=Kitasatospora sp. NPDC088391 TaxID=3364074 RepID=UPI0037F369CD
MSDEAWKMFRGVRDELMKLAQGEGLTPRKVELRTPYLMELVGAADGQTVSDLIRSFLDAMEPDKFTQALRNAFGGEGYPPTLTERRQRLGDELGLSVGGISTREEKAIDVMARRIIALAETRTAPEPQNQGALIAALNGLQDSIMAQTAILQEINGRLKRLGD